MQPAPHPNDDETDQPEDQTVADPLSDDTINLWNNTARKNREIFTEVFRPVPTNLIRKWKDYDVSRPMESVFEWDADACTRRPTCPMS